MLSIMPPAPLVDMPLMLLAPLGGYASACMGMDQYIVTPAAGSRSRHDPYYSKGRCYLGLGGPLRAEELLSPLTHRIGAL